MSGGEGVIRGGGNQQPDTLVQPAGPRPGNEVLQHDIAHQHPGGQPRKQEDTLFAVFLCTEQAARRCEPYGAAIAQHRELWHEKIQKRTGDDVLYPVQNAPVKVQKRKWGRCMTAQKKRNMRTVAIVTLRVLCAIAARAITRGHRDADATDNEAEKID